VTALFYIYFKNRQSPGAEEQTPAEPAPGIYRPDDYSPAPGPYGAYPAVEPLPYMPEPVVPEQERAPSDQHTIYAFEREVQVYVCPRCDGENSVSRHICCICGFEFRKGVW